MFKNALFLIVSFGMSIGLTFSQSVEKDLDSPKTILWEISGNGLKQSSYILGTNHMVEVDWLLSFSKFNQVIENTEVILTESFNTTQTYGSKEKGKIYPTAISLLSEGQFAYLDSFFVARVEDGIANNPDAEAMTVSEFIGAVYYVLTLNNSKADGVTKFMDLQLFEIYQKSGRAGDNLDSIKIYEYDFNETEAAKLKLIEVIKQIKGSDKPNWNIYHQDNLEEAISDYKSFNFDYYFNIVSPGDEPTGSPGYASLTDRNQLYMKKIIPYITEKSCLIAVGLSHLRFKVGVIALLKSQVYIVEPVPLP